MLVLLVPRIRSVADGLMGFLLGLVLWMPSWHLDLGQPHLVQGRIEVDRKDLDVGDHAGNANSGQSLGVRNSHERLSWHHYKRKRRVSIVFRTYVDHKSDTAPMLL